MNWRALILLVVALSVYAPFVGDSMAAEPSCCAQMMACSGHCNCNPKQACHVAKPVTTEQQIVTRATALAPRVDVELFTLALGHFSTMELDRPAFFKFASAPPLDTSQRQQARLCLWLI